MSTTEALKHGTTVLADTTSHAVDELADRAKKQAHALASQAAERLSDHEERPKRRGRMFLLGTALAAAVVGVVKLVRRPRPAAAGLEPVGMGGA